MWGKLAQLFFRRPDLVLAHLDATPCKQGESGAARRKLERSPAGLAGRDIFAGAGAGFIGVCADARYCPARGCCPFLALWRTRCIAAVGVGAGGAVASLAAPQWPK